MKTLSNLDLAGHRVSTMSPDFKVYHKVIGDEIEMVVKANTNTWIGLGWKPTGPLTCRNIGKLRSLKISIVSQLGG